MSTTRGARRTRSVGGLARACHPVPSLAVTALAAGLAAAVRLPPGRVLLVALAVLAGQLSIGWANDRLDADRDRAAGRQDKPVATGAVAPRTTAVAAAVAGFAATAAAGLLALRGAPGAGAVALVVLVAGLAYDAGLKATVWSWLPYALAFGSLPGIATLAAAPPRWPPAWAVAAGALLGVAAHLANVLPDLTADAATGVRGFPHRLGARPSAVCGVLALLVASVVVLLGPEGAPGPWALLSCGAAVVLGTGAGAAALREPASRRYFLAIIGVAALDVVSFALAGRW